MSHRRLSGLALFLLLSQVLGCASPTRKIEPHPGDPSPQSHRSSYQAGAGGAEPARGADAVFSAGAAAVNAVRGNGQGGKGSVPDLLRVHCETVEGMSCAFIGVTLKNLDGDVLSHRRTDQEGNVSFRVGGGGRYLIEASSAKHGAAFTPKGPFSAGAVVEMRLGEPTRRTISHDSEAKE